MAKTEKLDIEMAASRFVRLSNGIVVNVHRIATLVPYPGSGLSRHAWSVDRGRARAHLRPQQLRDLVHAIELTIGLL